MAPFVAHLGASWLIDLGVWSIYLASECRTYLIDKVPLSPASLPVMSSSDVTPVLQSIGHDLIQSFVAVTVETFAIGATSSLLSGGGGP